MTNFDLSNEVADKHGLTAYSEVDGRRINWLHEDSASCFELSVKLGVDITYWDIGVSASTSSNDVELFTIDKQLYKNHDNDKALATRVAILKCLLKMKE